MNLVKSRDIFNPSDFNERVHILGCGATGGTIAELLVRFGITKITLWDFDIVEDKNIANQIYRYIDIGKPKVEALKDILCDINPDLEKDLEIKSEGWNGETLEDYVYLCIDNIETHKEFVKKNKYNSMLKVVFETRLALWEGQHFAAEWSNIKHKDAFIANQNFTHEEAMEVTPRGGCNEVLSVVPTIREICSAGVSNLINYLLGKELQTMVIKRPFEFISDAVSIK